LNRTAPEILTSERRVFADVEFHEFARKTRRESNLSDFGRILLGHPSELNTPKMWELYDAVEKNDEGS
jgi:hypothetical protein